MHGMVPCVIREWHTTLGNVVKVSKEGGEEKYYMPTNVRSVVTTLVVV